MVANRSKVRYGCTAITSTEEISKVNIWVRELRDKSGVLTLERKMMER